MAKMAETKHVYVNQPLELRLDTEATLTSATVQIRYKNPDGVTGYWTGTASGTEARYSIPGNVLSVAGFWEFRAWITFSGAVAATPGTPFVQNVEATT
jgi:hypothetical protein